MKSYKEYNDSELLYLICEKNEDAYDVLYKKYLPIVEIKAKKYINFGKTKGLDINDLVQEGMIGLNEAIKDFKENKNIKFSTFASLCIERQISSSIKKANRQKHKNLNDSISIDDDFSKEAKTLLEKLFNKNELDPSEKMIKDETEKEINDKLKKILSPLEVQVLNYRIKGYEYKEIAERLNKSYKSIDSTIQRIKNKLKNNY
ncbi:MAG: sigma-70 family RNA polymerase sigma factor [Mollicutes bacterium]|nr:sigma-70 family RNA polymerase sigma factor [Mollicutes bacterium]